MKQIISIQLLFIISIVTYSQDIDKYFGLTNEARELFRSGDFSQSGLKFYESQTIAGIKPRFEDYYDAACSWALSNKTDSAFNQLLLGIDKYNYTQVDELKKDTCLTSLHNDSRWSELITKVETNKQDSEKKVDNYLAAILDTIYHDDQGCREKWIEVEKKYGYNSEEAKAMSRKVREIDSINTIKVTAIIDTYGWLGKDVVGEKGNTTIFLVIQHADTITQKKYLPIMREAVKNNNARPKDLALLEDRVGLYMNNLQVYGSQLFRDPSGVERYCVRPLIDPENVNKKRYEVGLGSIEEYVNFFGCSWSIERYYKILPLVVDQEKIAL